MSLLGFVSAVFVIGALVFFHELGHFLVAKYCGVGVLRFAVGFGPTIWRYRRGETTYQIGIIPLGGYVRMVGDISDVITGDMTDTRGKSLEGESVENGGADGIQKKGRKDEAETLTPEECAVIKDQSRWFINKSRSQQAAVIAAGPIANFLLAIALTWFSVFALGVADMNDEAVIGAIARKMPAGLVGLELGDRVTRIDGVAVPKWADLVKRITEGHGKTVTLDVLRGEQPLSFTVTPVIQKGMEDIDESRKRYVIGVQPKIEIRKAGFLESFLVSMEINYKRTAITLSGVWGMLSGQISPKELAGPVFIFTQSGEQAERGWDSLFDFMALLSISLGVLNLLPIPILDGGHLLFMFLESILGPISLRRKEQAQQVGAVLLILLMLTAVRNDFTRPPFPKAEDVGWDFGDKTKVVSAPANTEPDPSQKNTELELPR